MRPHRAICKPNGRLANVGNLLIDIYFLQFRMGRAFGQKAQIQVARGLPARASKQASERGGPIQAMKTGLFPGSRRTVIQYLDPMPHRQRRPALKMSQTTDIGRGDGLGPAGFQGIDLVLEQPLRKILL